MANIAINGFGRIGRAFLKLALMKPELNVVAINDLGDLENLAYLLRYDSVYGRYAGQVSTRRDGDEQWLIVDGRELLFLQERDPLKLPWKDLNIDIVVEATGVFASFEKAAVHQEAGAKRVVLTAPAKDEDRPGARTVLMGVNEDEIKACTMTSNGSCTTNSVSPVLAILSEKLGIKKAFLNTVHGYTATQALIDGPTKGHDMRRGRAAAVNIVPSTTGAATATARAVTVLAEKFDGIAMRVPVVSGSLSSVTFVAERPTTPGEINDFLRAAAAEPRWQGIFSATDDQLVSTDILGQPFASIADLSLTKVVDGDLCAVYAWYDNEFGYTVSLVQHVQKAALAL